MKCFIKCLAVFMLGASVFTACSNDDDNDSGKRAVDVSEGLFIVGSGNKRAGIGGNLSYINYATGTVTSKAFETVNGKALGQTANYVAIYGSKLYIVVDGEATIWVCDKKTLKVEKQIITTTLLDATKGVSPRAIVGAGDKIYFTCYGNSINGGNGIVAALDTLTFSKFTTYEVGSYPDGLTVCSGYLFVANSDYGNNVNPSLSKIDLQSGAVTTIKDAAITNPMMITTIGNNVYYLDYGTYDANWNQTGQGVRRVTVDGKVTKVCDGTAMGTDGKRIFAANAPYGGETKYYIYDPATDKATEWNPADINNPAVITADPVTGNIFITSYSKSTDPNVSTYALPTYTNQYDAQGNFVKKYEGTATGAVASVFNTGVKYE